MSVTAVVCFAIVIGITLVITAIAARRTRSAADFYVAGGRISGTQNGLAIAGDFMSAATLLGTTALVFSVGYDAAIYLGASMVAFAIFIFFLTDKLRALGRFTFTDVLAARLDPVPIRALAAVTALVSALMYLMVQVVGAGALIQVLFDIDYAYAVVLVSLLMVIYVAVGGMLATTWVQITKAILLLVGISVLAFLTLAEFDFDIAALAQVAAERHSRPDALIAPGGLGLSTLASLSLGLGLAFGLLGSPHLLMRFFTVPDAYQARKSAVVAGACVAYVGLLIFFVVGWGTVAFVKGDPAYYDGAGVAGGENMVAVHLARHVGGDVFFGIMSAVAFATILAVVAGLTLACASAVSHDLYAGVFKRGAASEAQEVRVSRLTTVGVGVVMIFLGWAFEGQNVAYLVSLALAVAASTNFPLLVLAIYWDRFTTRAAILGGIAGLVTTITLTILSPAVWVSVLGNDDAVFPSPYPALYSMLAAITVMVLVSLLGPRDARAATRADD
ncbi:MAG: cation acetate symporter [Pseudomonadota bacterium]